MKRRSRYFFNASHFKIFHHYVALKLIEKTKRTILQTTNIDSKHLDGDIVRKNESQLV